MIDRNETLVAIASLPLMLGGAALEGVDWRHGDDLCDCRIQRIGEHCNPYSGHTHRVRLCCLEAKLIELLPELAEYVQDIPAYFDEDRGAFVDGVVAWDSVDSDMPRALWYRQIAHVTGKTLAEVRAEYSDREPPAARFTPAQLAAFARAEHLAAADEAAEEEGY